MVQSIDNKVNNYSWTALEGPGSAEFNRDFASRIEGDGISSCFRSNNFENNLSKYQLQGKALQVGVLNFFKTGKVFQKNEGIVGYLNDSIGQGYGPGTHFLKVVKGLIEGYCKGRGIKVVVEKEGVALIVEAVGGKLPENFSKELGQLIYRNRGKFDFVTHKNTVNVLDLLGRNNIKIGFGYTDIPLEENIYVGQTKEAVRELYGKVKFNNWTGKVELANLLKMEKKIGVEPPVKVIVNFLNHPSIIRDYYKHRDIFERSLNTLPDEYMDILEMSFKNGQISHSTYEYCKMVSLRFADIRYSRLNEGIICLNENGVHLLMDRAMKHPEKARNFIGITGADELSGQIVMKDCRAFNFSLDINNLGGINREFGSAAGDQFIEAHIKAFDDVRKLINEGKITAIEDVFIEYYKMINLQTIIISKSSMSKEGLKSLQKYGTKDKGDLIETKIGDLERVYSKDRRPVNKLVHKGATGTVVVTGIEVNDRRGVRRTEEFLRDEVKNLKSKAGKDGSKIEIRLYGGLYYRSTLIKLNGDKKEITTKSVERMTRTKESPKDKTKRTVLSEEIFGALKDVYGEKVASEIKNAKSWISIEQFDALNNKISSGISKMSAAELSKELSIEEYKAERIITAAKGSINKQFAGNILSLVTGYAGMTAAGKLIDKFAPDMNPVLQFSAMVYTGHNINHLGLNIAESIKAGKLPKSLLDLKGGFKAVNPWSMRGGLAASGAWNLAMESLGVSRDSTLRNSGSTAAFFAPDAYKISAKYLAQKYGWKLLPSGRLAATGQALGAIAITNFAFGMIGAGMQHLTLDSYNRSVVSRAADLYLQEHSKGLEKLLYLPKRVTDALGAKAFTDIAYAQDAEIKAITEGDRQYMDGIENALKITFGTALFNGLGSELLSGGEFVNLPPESIEKGRGLIKENIKNLVKDKESRKMFEEWQSFMRLYSSANFIDIPKELIELKIDKLDDFIPSESVVKWAARKGKLEADGKTIEILSVIKEANKMITAQKK